MNCEDVDRLLDPYLDSELEPSRQLRLEEHLRSCPACQSLALECQEFQSFFRENAPAYKAPPQLRSNVLAMFRRESSKQALTFLHQPWIYAAAVLAVGLCATTLLVPDSGKELSNQAVGRFAQSLANNHLVDVASSDAQVLKPWFTAKLNFTPPLVDLFASGYTLLGGRTDVIQNRSVATLVYGQAKNVVTLFCWPSNKEQISTGNHSIEGCNVSTWSNADCNYIVVSKMDKRKLDDFVDSLRGRAESGSYF
jgi:anti-sigma factor RsiW